MSSLSSDTPTPATDTNGTPGKKAQLSRWQIFGMLGVAILLFAGIAWRNPLCRETAVDLLGRTGPWSVPWLLAAMDDSDLNVQKVAIEGITRAGPAAIPALLHDLQSSRPAKQAHATSLLCISDITDGKEDAVCTALLPLLNAVDHEPRLGAIMAISSLGARGKPAISVLKKLLDHNDQKTRQSALHGIVRIDRDNPATLEFILKILSHRQDELRAQACGELEELETKDPRVVTALIKCLEDPSDSVRLAAADYLGEMGPVARPALEPLRKLAQADPNPDVRRKANQGVRELSVVESP